MPLNSYLWVHKDAILTDQEKNTLIDWAQGIVNDMKAKYPSDSLVKKEPHSN
jgi:Haem-binding domain